MNILYNRAATGLVCIILTLVICCGFAALTLVPLLCAGGLAPIITNMGGM